MSFTHLLCQSQEIRDCSTLHMVAAVSNQNKLGCNKANIITRTTLVIAYFQLHVLHNTELKTFCTKSNLVNIF